jgi:hypothetical protein
VPEKIEGTHREHWPDSEPGDDEITDPDPSEPPHLGQGHLPGTLYGCRGCEERDCQHEPGDGDDWCVSDSHPPRTAETDEPGYEVPRRPATAREQSARAASRSADPDREAGS